MAKETIKTPWPKKIVFILLTLVILSALAEVGLRLVKKAVSPAPTASKSGQSECGSITFLCIGDSMTFGLGAPSEKSYPMQMPFFWEIAFKGIPVKVFNIGTAGQNTSEEFRKTRYHIETRQGPKPDYALILIGINNRWNLHEASFWDWDKGAKKENYLDYLGSKFQLSKFFKLAELNASEQAARAKDTHGSEYRVMLQEHGWDMFFDSFEDELLSGWIERDLLEMAKYLRGRNIEPIFLTYHYERWGHLNDIIRASAKKAGAKLIDLEKPKEFYIRQNMLAKDYFHFNAKGYRAMARRIVEAISANYKTTDFEIKLKDKLSGPECVSK